MAMMLFGSPIGLYAFLGVLKCSSADFADISLCHRSFSTVYLSFYRFRVSMLRLGNYVRISLVYKVF